MKHWIESLPWADPISGIPMDMIVSSRGLNGRPLVGALVVRGTNIGYPILNGVPRLTSTLARHYEKWLFMQGLQPPVSGDNVDDSQDENSVESFGFQWSWDNAPRTASDLNWRVASRFNEEEGLFKGKLVLDAGCGAGAQSGWLLGTGCARLVVSIDLSSAIDVSNTKLSDYDNWIGIQGDVTNIPFLDNSFEIIYCEGVIQHTQNSLDCVTELARVARNGATILATHYTKSKKFLGMFNLWLISLGRRYTSRIERDKLFLLCGFFSLLTYIPLAGSIMGRSILPINYRMKSLKSRWCHIYDCYGLHHHQRYIFDEEFQSYFIKNNLRVKLVKNGCVSAVK